MDGAQGSPHEPVRQATGKRPFSALSQPTTGSERVVFNVGGTRFETTKATLANFPEDSYIGKLLNAANESICKPDPDGSYFIDRDSRSFGAILSALRRSSTPSMPEGMDRREWLDDLTFWGMASKEELRQEVEIIKRAHADQESLSREFFAVAKSIHHFLKDEVVPGEFTAHYLPNGVADKRFIAAHKDLDVGDFRLSFSWGDSMRTRAIREFLYNMGIAVRLASYKPSRIRCKYIKPDTLLWRLIGEMRPSTSTMLVTKIEVSKPEPGSSFGEFDEGEIDLEPLRRMSGPSDACDYDDYDGDSSAKVK